MVLRAAVLALVAAVPFFVACSTGSSEDRNWDEPEIKGEGNKSNIKCAHQTCKSLGKTCGEHDDGCGGKVTCGACVDQQCTPKTCKELGKTCGKVADDCG